MVVPLVLGLLGLVALMASNKKPAAQNTAALVSLLPNDLAGLAKQAMATNDPNVLLTAADTLDARGFHEQAQALRDQAAAAQRASSAKGGNAALPPALQTLMAQALAALTVSGSGQIMGPVTADAIKTATAIAAQIDQAGFPDAAAALRVFINKAQSVLPPPTPAQTLPLPGLTPQLAAQVNQAIQAERDPVKLRQLIAILKGLPPNPQTQQAIDTLSALADQIDATIAAATAMQQIQKTLPANLPTPAPAPPGPLPAPSPAPAPSPSAPKTPQQILAETTATGLVRLQSSANGNVKAVQGKENKTDVMRFQKQESQTADGKAGPNTLLALAKYTGNLPLVMYWPQKSNASSVLTYRSKLLDLADAADAAGDTVRGAGLRAAAVAERGQGGIVGSMPA